MKHRLVNVQGYIKPLFVDSYIANCGTVVDGISFHFGQGSEDEGSWVIALEELEAICREARETRKAHGLG